ncbi:SusC/RagA family TonB-linked outer membrane protein [Chitinophaga lutea]
MRHILALSLACLISLGAFAQQVIRGTVRDSVTKAPIPGATIRVVNGSGGVTTNEKGEFELKVPANAELRISSIGFETILVPARKISVVPIMLRTSATLLQSSVVVGYGSQQRRQLTNSISSLSSQKLAPENNIVSDVGKALQGRIPGVFVASTSGAPGNTPNIQIRGIQSVRPENGTPLIVIDGLIMEGSGISLNSINPQDIESIDVLKDAASAAIYGARGSTGVIIITTKKGKQGQKPAFSVNAYTGFNNVPTSRRMLNTQEYESAFRDARNNRIADIDKQLTDPSLTPLQITALQNQRNTWKSQLDALQMADRSNDWIDRVKNKRAPVNNIQASMSGGGDKNNYYMSLGRYSEEASIGTGQFERYTGKIDITQQVNRWLKLNGNINISQAANKNFSYPLVSAFNLRPDTPEEPTVLPDGSLGYYVGRQQHPLGEMRENRNKRRTLTYFGNLSAEVQLHRTLQFRSVFSANKYNVYGTDYQSPFGYLGSFNKGYVKASGADNFNYNFDNYLTYTNRWKKLGVTATAGYAFYSLEQTAFGYELNGFPRVDGITGPAAGAAYGSVFAISSLNGNVQETSEAYFGRVGFDWDGKYMLNASLRTDGSSKLDASHRYAWFPSVSAGWDLARENFLQSVSKIDFLKLRASYGISGNIRPLQNFSTIDVMTATTYLGDAALKMRDIIGFPDLRWEETKQVDAGIDVGLFKNRVNLTVDYYNKTTDGLLSNRFIPWEFGAQTIPFNVGSIRNAGFDMELSVSSRRNAAFTWKVETNMNLNRNQVISLADSAVNYGAFVFGGPMSKARVGQSVGSVEVYNALGVDPQTGDMIYEDRNKDGIYNNKDYVTVPIACPKFTGGTNLTFGYANFTLEALFSYVVGTKVYDYYEQTLRNYDMDFYGVMPNKFNIVTERWRKPGDVASVPRAIVGPHGAGKATDWNYRPSTQFVYDASYLRLRNLSLAYNVPAKLLEKADIKRCRIYASAQNVFTVTKYIGFDPEAASTTGIVSTNLPNARAMVIGVDLSF